MISSIRLQHFRSYTDATFQLSPEVTIVSGPNASGKTNLLEAVLVMASGKSYRAKDQELVQHDQEWARLDVMTATGKRTLKITKNPALKLFELDGAPAKRLSGQRTTAVVLFEPNHMLLFQGAPELRRNFLDDLLEQLSPRFGEYRRHYKRVLIQRNALLKKKLPGQLFVWNVRLSELGGKIAKERAQLVEQYNQQLSHCYSQICGKKATVALTYSTQFPLDTYETALLHKLEQTTDLDLLRGFTASGPHRDDLAATLNNRPLQETASRGENRTLVLSLKRLELEFLEAATKTKPVLLLDDVFSELDSTRRKALTRFVHNYQTVITTTDADTVTPGLAGNSATVVLTTNV